MAAGRAGVAFVLAAGIGCAHLGASRPDKPALAAGKYAVESIRSRAQLDGRDQLIEINESGTKLTDANGAEHVLTERGALVLVENGSCRLALAVSVDGEEPGISDRPCSWRVEGDRFLLGDAAGAGTRTVYRVRRGNGRVVLEGLSDLDGEGNVVGDASGERIVLVERRPELAGRSADRTSEEQATREIQEYLHDL
jgi:tetrahydromethanopterin S-methyltransferase subunit F